MSSKKKRPSDKPLTVTVRNGVLSIEIGVATNAFATLHSEYVWRLNGNHKASGAQERQVFAIKNPTGFAKDVKRALLDEKEDGSSLLTELFDRAAMDAIDDGAEHFINTTESDDE